MITNNYPSRSCKLGQFGDVLFLHADVFSCTCFSMETRTAVDYTSQQNHAQILSLLFKNTLSMVIAGPLLLGCFQTREQGAKSIMWLGPKTRVWCPGSSRRVIHRAQCAENSGKLWNWRVTNNKRHRDSDRREWPPARYVCPGASNSAPEKRIQLRPLNTANDKLAWKQ